MNSYQILNAWEGFCRKNPRLVKPLHHAILLHAIVVCNRLQWPDEFQLPTDVACQFIGIVDRETFNKGLKGLIDFGAIREVQPARGLHVARFVSFISASLYLPIESAGSSVGSPARSQNSKVTKTTKTKSVYVDKPPTTDEVRNAFIEYGGNIVVADAFVTQFLAHYEINEWRYGKNQTPIKNFKSAVRTWNPKGWQPRSSNYQNGSAKPATTPLLIEDR